MIKAELLGRQYGNIYAVKGLSFEVKRGEVMGLLGPNGAGKSTTMKMLTCFLPPSSGEAWIGGLSLTDSMKVRRLVGYLPEHAPSYHDLDVEAYLQFVGKIHGVPQGTRQDKIKEMVAVCGLEAVVFRRIDELSKGYRQRVGLAASMLHDPECLILDEPTTGLDPNQIVEIRHLIRRLGEQKTVLLSSHILPEVEAVCDRMMIIDKGELQALGTTAELSKQAQGGVLVSATIQGDVERFMAQLRPALPDIEVLHQKAVEDGATHVEIQHPDPECKLAQAVFHAAVASGAVLLEMRNERASLEDIFHQLTQGGQAS